MASLRGGELLWGTEDNIDRPTSFAAQTVKSSGDATATSAVGYVGSGPYVSLFIDNTGGSNAATVKVQACGSPAPSAGLNNIPSYWSDYQKVAGTTLSFTINASTSMCFDLSPFGPELIRLVRTDSTGDTTILAFITANGPN